jgi:hypothetical protein
LHVFQEPLRNVTESVDPFSRSHLLEIAYRKSYSTYHFIQAAASWVIAYSLAWNFVRILSTSTVDYCPW